VREEALRDLALTVDGRRVPLRLSGAGTIGTPAGEGGLTTTRVKLELYAKVPQPREVAIRDGTYADRVGWKAVLVGPGVATAVRSSAPLGDPTNGLRSYPQDLLESPADVREASFSVRPGAGTVSAPDGTRSIRAEGGERRGSDGFAGLFEDAAAGQGVLLLLLGAAFGWGALHALSPGHGKAMVAAYLVGTRGTTRDAVVLGVTVTFTHTIGVIALGLVALLLSAYILPENLYPWLQLASGLLVVLVGASVLRARLRGGRAVAEHHHHHEHHEGHHHTHGGGHAHSHGHAHGHTHGEGHAHHHEGHSHADRPPRRGLIALGASAGLIPCPSALVVLLGAVAQHQLLLGLVLIFAFSAGLALTLTILGVAVVRASRTLSRLRVPGHAATALPVVSAVVIVGVGCLLAAQAVPQLA